MARFSSSFQGGVVCPAPVPETGGFESMLSASWPIATSAWRCRPEPPRPPPRRPSDLTLEVPFLELPTAPCGGKRRAHSASASGLVAHGVSQGTSGPAAALKSAPLLEEAEDEDGLDGGSGSQDEEGLEDEDEDAACVFALDGDVHDGIPDEEDHQPPVFQYQLVGLDELMSQEKSPRLDKGLDSDLGVSQGGTRRASGSLLNPGSASWKARAGRDRSGSASPPLGASPMLLSALSQVAAEADLNQRQRSGTT